MSKNTLWLAFLVLPACAYQSAMKGGETASAAAEHDKAMRAYAFAYDTKASDEAKAGLDRARASVIEAKLTEAKAKADAKEHVASAALLQEVEVLSAEAEGLNAAREHCRTQMMGSLESDVIELDDLRKGYELATLARDLYPEAPEPEFALGMVRDLSVAEGLNHLAAEKYSEGLAAIALIEEMEPWEKVLTGKLKTQISTAWAEDFRTRAKAAERKQPGLAAVLYARAHEIGEDAADAEASARFYETAAELGPLSVYIDSGGGGGRVTGLRDATRATVDGIPGLTAGKSGKRDLLVKVYAPALSCKESKEVEKLTKDYIAGQKEIPNEAYNTTADEVAAATRVSDAADKAVSGVQPDSLKASEKEKALKAEQQTAKTALDEATKVRTATETQRVKSAASVKELKDEIAKMDGDKTEAEAKLTKIEGFAKEWEDKLAVDSKTEADAQSVFDKVDAQLTEAAAEAKTLGDELAKAEAAQKEATRTLATLNAKLGKVSPTESEDISETLKYDKISWTNTCTGTVTAYITATWTPKPDSPYKVELERTSSDASHIGHEKAGLKEDTKAYPKAKDAMLEELEDESQKKLDALTKQLATAYFTGAITAAFDNEDADAATDALTQLYAGAAERMDTGTRDKYKMHLADTYGLEKFESLDATEAPPPMSNEPPAPEPESEAPEPEATAAAKPEPAAAPKPEPAPDPASPWGATTD